MSITLLDGATTSTTGGTTQTFSRTNTPVNNGYEYSDVSEADFFKREKVLLSARQPTLQSNGTWSKQKSYARYVKPLTKADGTVVYNGIRVEIDYDPETPAADLAELREKGAQMAKASQFNDLYVAGTLPA